MATTERPVRLYTSPFGLLSGAEVDRLIHCVEVGHGRLAEDVEQFKAAAANGDQPMYTAEAMTRMAAQFQQYVDEGVALATKLRCARDAGMLFTLGGYDPQETVEALAEVEEALAEEASLDG